MMMIKSVESKFQHFKSNEGMSYLRVSCREGCGSKFHSFTFAPYLWLNDDIVPKFDHKDTKPYSPLPRFKGYSKNQATV